MTPDAKQLGGDLCELRPEPYRVFFYWDRQEQSYVLLNGFRKKSDRTPLKELETARVLMLEHTEMIGHRGKT